MKYQIKPIPNRKGYWADTDGNIWSKKRRGVPKRIGTCVGSNGYFVVVMRHHRKASLIKVHHLILETFVGKKPEELECCHNNGNKLDNRLDNLRWDTRRSNIQDLIKHGKLNTSGLINGNGEKNANAKLNYWQVRIIRKYKKYNGYQNDLANFFNIKQSTISHIINNKLWRIET